MRQIRHWIWLAHALLALVLLAIIAADALLDVHVRFESLMWLCMGIVASGWLGKPLEEPRHG